MKIKAAFNKETGEAVSIYAVEVQGRLVIAKSGRFDNTKTDDTFLIANNPLTQNADMRFSADDFGEAVEAYRALVSAGRCVIQEDLQRYKPDNVLEIDGTQENGKPKYNISALHNGHYAMLAVCLFYFRRKQRQTDTAKISAAFDMLEQAKEESRIGSYAVGGFFITI